MSSSNEKNKFLIPLVIVIIVGGMTAFGYQMYEHNNRAIEASNNIDFPDDKETTREWIKNDGANICPILLEQRFDENESHYRCL